MSSEPEAKEEKAVLGGLADFAKYANHSWLKLNADPDEEKNKPNFTSREVKSGHFVRVRPHPLNDPTMVAFSEAMAKELGLSNEACNSDQFTAFFSGDMDKLPVFQSWATPYALSIYGDEMYQNCPFGNGNGYGDGRAISIAEVLLPNGARWEMQLKGGGPTPFCRGADGRAVLRSSVREFLVSEAMFHLGVSTTRALSLVVSNSDRVLRAWYSGKVRPKPNISIHDPRLSHIPMEMRQMVIDQATGGKEPDMRVRERCAITCRVAPSFLRVGHVELFGRRARKAGPDSNEMTELRMLVQHLMEREYPQILEKESDFQAQCLMLLSQVSANIAKLTANWIRVGFVQSNFNSDNCLAAGRTMDYGPFGFMQRFKPLWCMWTGGGNKFGFLNQPVAGAKNFESFMTAVTPLLNQESKQLAEVIQKKHYEVATNETQEAWRQKLGLNGFPDSFGTLLNDILELMERSEADYTLFWRQLAHVPSIAFASGSVESGELGECLMLPLKDVFYQPLETRTKESWVAVLERWITLLKQEGRTATQIEEQMRQASPKYIPREWMLVKAYEEADKGNFDPLKELLSVFEKPYDEQPEFEAKYYKKAPPETYAGQGLGGQDHMT